MNAYLRFDRTNSSFPVSDLVSGYASASAERNVCGALFSVGKCLWHAPDLP